MRTEPTSSGHRRAAIATRGEAERELPPEELNERGGER
jgi:hypothetical protein